MKSVMKKYLLDKIRKEKEFENMPDHTNYDSDDWRNFIIFLWSIDVNCTNHKLRKRAKDFLAWIDERYEKLHLSEKLYKFTHNIVVEPQCYGCDKKVKFLNPINGYRKYCTPLCAISNTEVLERVKKSNLEKYGIGNTLSLPHIKEKIKQTNLKKYGAENPFAAKTIKDKIKKHNIERYGVENPAQRDDIKIKIQKTNIERYGIRKKRYCFKGQKYMFRKIWR